MAIEKKPSTPQREARRRYEEKRRTERKTATCLFGTQMPREEAAEINAFLKRYAITKIDLIREGYRSMKEMMNNPKG